MQLLQPGSSLRPLVVGNSRRRVLSDGRIEITLEGRFEGVDRAAPMTLILSPSQARHLARCLFHSTESLPA